MSKPTGPQIGAAAVWMSIVSQLFSTRMAILLEPHAMTVGQFSILNHIVRMPPGRPARVSDIAAAVEVGQPAVTKALAKFHNLGLVTFQENAGDKRSKLVIANPAAGALLGQIYQGIGPDLGGLFGQMGEEKLVEFTQQLKSLGQWLDKNRLS